MVEVDPNDKYKRQSPFKSLMKWIAIVLGCVGVIAAIRIQKGLVEEQRVEVSKTDRIKASANSNVNQESESQQDPASKSAAKPKGPEPVLTSDATEEHPDEPVPKSNPNLSFNINRPVLVLSLPHNGDLAVTRYFQCGGVAPQELGRYWTSREMPIGRCFQNNMKNNATMKLNCGDYAVYSELHYWEPARTKGKLKHDHRCFDPVLYPGALEELYQSFPNAIVLAVQQHPRDWYYSLPRDLKIYWRTHCNPTHQNKFPSSTKSLTQWLDFYHEYHMAIIQFVQDHPGWEFITVDLDQNTRTVADRLENKFNIPSKCWIDSVDATLQSWTDPNLPTPKRPNTIHYPILDISLPKSGSNIVTNQYFRCGLGVWSAVTQWTTPSASTREQPLEDIPIGRCIQQNVQAEGNTNILKGCGRARIWGDIGFLRDNINNGTCYYPTLQPQAMEKFASYYPNATLLNVVRPYSEWYDGAVKFNDLPNRWARAKNCPGFPSDGTDRESWESFYRGYINRMRKFAAKHPNMTYIEIPMSGEGGKLLQDVFRFPEDCWPSSFPEDYRYR